MEKVPEKDELVIATIRKIFPYGAFCTLDEFDNREAFVHISEVASRWVKNIHEFLKENQKVVARVYHFVPEKNQIDLSMRRVSEAERKLKLESLKRDKRAGSLLRVLAKRVGKDPAVFLADMGPRFVKEFGGEMEAFEGIAANPESVGKLNLSKEVADALVEISTQNVKKPTVEVTRTLNVTSMDQEGVDVITKLLSSFESMSGEGTEVKISYLGAPNYLLRITSDDYKSAEKAVQAIIKKGSDELRKHHGAMVIADDEKK